MFNKICYTSLNMNINIYKNSSKPMSAGMGLIKEINHSVSPQSVKFFHWRMQACPNQTEQDCWSDGYRYAPCKEKYDWNLMPKIRASSNVVWKSKVCNASWETSTASIGNYWKETQTSNWYNVVSIWTFELSMVKKRVEKTTDGKI